jgi:3,4-dihydroxy 2-butanone 4-phosphate synthase/GTP cyclohydrolase II
MVRMHQVNLLGDMFADASSPRTGELHKAMDIIAQHGSGVVVLLDSMPGRLAERIRAEARGDHHTTRLMDYGVGAQILADLGVHEMILLTNTSKVVVGLEGYGLHIAQQRPIPLP